MEKLSQAELVKLSNMVGRIHALNHIGYSPEQIKTAFVNRGFNAEHVDVLIKEAFLGALAGTLGRGIVGAGRALSGAGGRAALSGASKAMAPARAGLAGRLGQMGAKAQQSMGGMLQGAGRGLSRSGVAFARNPLKATGKGLLNFGQGAMLGGGKGLGGTLGKGVFGVSMANMLMPGGQSPQIPQPYGQYGNPYGSPM